MQVHVRHGLACVGSILDHEERVQFTAAVPSSRLNRQCEQLAGFLWLQIGDPGDVASWNNQNVAW